MGGYGSIPDVECTSYGPRFYEICANALNVNNDSVGFNKDVSRSLTFDGDAALADLIKADGTNSAYRSNDATNFAICLPVEPDFSFQQGQTANSPITYSFKGKMKDTSAFAKNVETQPIFGFLKSSVLAVQLRGEGQPPIVSLDEFDITSPSE
jgi:hypothetical protein